MNYCLMVAISVSGIPSGDVYICTSLLGYFKGAQFVIKFALRTHFTASNIHDVTLSPCWIDQKIWHLYVGKVGVV
jgi:hypothetical protein